MVRPTKADAATFKELRGRTMPDSFRKRKRIPELNPATFLDTSTPSKAAPPPKKGSDKAVPFSLKVKEKGKDKQGWWPLPHQLPSLRNQLL